MGKPPFTLRKNIYHTKKAFCIGLKISSSEEKLSHLREKNGFIAWSKDLIQTEDKWKIFFERYLNKTVIVDSIENALKLSRKYNEFDFVTVDGDYIDQLGIIEGGSIPKLDDSVFGRKQLLQNLKKDFGKREIELVTVKDKIDETENNLSLIDLRVLSEQGRMLQNDIANIEKQIAQFEFEKKKPMMKSKKQEKKLKTLLLNQTSLITNGQI
ncbi:MAG: hypothetical protein MZV64_62270 [Ignavibacteriales bacterium]|nr:hypothetical protein [Ignavibacteriales bacterium]